MHSEGYGTCRCVCVSVCRVQDRQFQRRRGSALHFLKLAIFKSYGVTTKITTGLPRQDVLAQRTLEAQLEVSTRACIDSRMLSTTVARLY